MEGSMTVHLTLLEQTAVTPNWDDLQLPNLEELKSLTTIDATSGKIVCYILTPEPEEPVQPDEKEPTEPDTDQPATESEEVKVAEASLPKLLFA